MNVGLTANLPVIFGVLTCLDEEQEVKKRSSGDSNHGYDWGKTAVEMALLRSEAVGSGKPSGMGFSSPTELKVKDAEEGEKKKVEFF